MNAELLRERCDAYVFGLLDGQELHELEALLAQRDPAALQQLKESTDLAAMIAYSAPEAEPPAILRSRVLNEVRKSTGAGQVSRRPSRIASLGWAVAAGLALVTYFAWSRSEQTQRELAKTQTQVERLTREASRNQRVLAILMARDSRTIRLATTGPDAPQFRAYWSKPNGLVLVGSNVTTPAAGRAMQLWVVPKTGNPISAGVFAPDANGKVILIAETNAAPEDAAALAISDEPAGGSPQPTTKPAWVGALGD